MRFRVLARTWLVLACTWSSTVPAQGLSESRDLAPLPIENAEVRVTMPDGARLWGCLTRPVDADAAHRYPAILMFDPYSGKCDGGIPGWKYYAEHGYVASYFHVRGTGLSEGKLPEREYSEGELRDAVSLVGWLSQQPWSSGTVGMYGHSWSGFNAIQVAMRRPPALKTIVAQVATEDMYHEGERFPDGIFHFDSWNAYADLLVTTPEPADPLSQSALEDRFDQPPWTLVYSKHSRDDDFWRPDIRIDRHPEEMTVPIMMLGGWYDGYRNAIYRALTNLRVSRKAIIGPWNHRLDNPAPLADLDRETLRWWDFWLKGKPTGVLQDPQLIAYMRRPYAPSAMPGAIPGSWRAVDAWPPTGLTQHRLYFRTDRSLSGEASRPGSHLLRYVPSSGIEVGTWWGDPMPDQRLADARALVCETPPLSEEVAILGEPRAQLRASASAPQADWFVRLSDVAPDGTVALVTGGALNGSQRDSSAQPQTLIPNRVYDLKLSLLFTSWIFEKGHRVRVSVSNAQWPMYWPTPYPMTSTLQMGGDSGSQITLPVVPAVSTEDSLRAAKSVGSFNVSKDRIEQVAVIPKGWSGPANVYRDNLHGETSVSFGGKDLHVEYRVADQDPAHASVVGTRNFARDYAGHRIEWRGRTRVTSDTKALHIQHTRELRRDGKLFRRREWNESIPREFN